MKTYIIYHDKCTDGFTAAWSAYKCFGIHRDVEYIPMTHGNKLPQLDDYSNVYFVDFCLKSKEELIELANRMYRVTVLDHHKTALDLFGANTKQFIHTNNKLEVRLDMTKSGALIAWEHFNSGEPIPALVAHVSDRDLWQFKLPGTKELHAALGMMEMSFDNWDRANSNVNGLIEQGKLILEYEQLQTEKLCIGAYWTNIMGHSVPVVNTSLLMSEVAMRLLDIYPSAPFAVCYTDRADGYKHFSLRSKIGFDVSEIAKAMGGGGHAQASGFRVPRI